jgi:hypothetical protein
MTGRVNAEAISRRLPSTVARVRSKAASSAICGGQIATMAGFSQGTSFSLPVLILPPAPTLYRLVDTTVASLNNQQSLRKEPIATEQCPHVFLQLTCTG